VWADSGEEVRLLICFWHKPCKQ